MDQPTAPPQLLGSYRLVEPLGEGGMGLVHLAYGSDGRLVAVKVLRPWLVGGRDGRARFEREVAALRRVRGPRVAEVLDADVTADPPYVVTRYVRGPSLDRVVADHGPLRGPALMRVAVGLAEALETVHAAGVVHRDVKPGNVLIADGGPVLIDFGLAHALGDSRLTATGLVIGTPGYLAPETVLGRDPVPGTDVHGWAGTVVFAATGRAPYGSGHEAVVLDRIRRGEYDLAGVEPDLADLLRYALAGDPVERPTVRQLSRALRAVGGPATDPAAPAAGAALAAAAASTGWTAPAAATAALGPAVPPTRVDLPPVPPAARAPHAAGPPAATPPAAGAAPAVYAGPSAGAAPAVYATPRSAGPSAPPPNVVPPASSPPVAPRLQRPAPATPDPPAVSPRPASAGPAPSRPAPVVAPLAPPVTSLVGRALLAAVAMLLVAIGVAAPYIGSAVLLGTLTIARTAWRVRRRLYERQLARGPQRSDGVLAAIGAPWHLVTTAFPSLVQTAVVVAAGALVGIAALGAGAVGPRVPYVLGGAFAVLLAWFGPGAARVRRGGRVLVAAVTRDPRAGWVVAVLVALAAWALGLWWESYGTNWWPGSPPELQFPTWL
ncbi:MAG TPA: serine/threonine-protein kinase [Jiangellales bacterium]|nr:serine/threonine-protein kinase [Jiangellales bacterium]